MVKRASERSGAFLFKKNETFLIFCSYINKHYICIHNNIIK